MNWKVHNKNFIYHSSLIFYNSCFTIFTYFFVPLWWFYKGLVALLHLSSYNASVKLQRNFSCYHFWGSKKSSLRNFQSLLSSNDQRLSDLFLHKMQTCQHDCLVTSVRWAFLLPLESIFPCKHDMAFDILFQSKTC